MSSWVALNVEPDEAVEEEVDDTKEIQVEEALKLYQNALKLHSLGPQYYAQAAEAYDALLKSDIFKYPESFSDYSQSSLQDSEAQPGGAYDDAVGEPLGETDVNYSTSSSLFQAIYLSYKNYGQYLLDSLHDLLRNASQTTEVTEELASEVTTRSSSALSSFADALERDDTDLDLWRKSARISSALKSYRLVRFCLESVLADDDNRLEVRAEQLGLDETCAEDSLRETLQLVHDRLWASQVPIKKPKKALLKFLRRHIDPYPYLPSVSTDLQGPDPSKSILAVRATRHTLQPVASTWLSVGEAVLQTIVDEDRDAINLGPGAAIYILLPTNSPEAVSPTIGERKTSDESSGNPNSQDLPAKKDGTANSEEKEQNTMVEPNFVAETRESDTAVKSSGGRSASERGEEKQSKGSLEHQAGQSPEVANRRENANLAELEHRPSIGVSRKRSSTSVANEENADVVRTKSRRTRAREPNVDALPHEEVAFDLAGYYEDQLRNFFQADDLLFGKVGVLLDRIGVEELGKASELRKQAFVLGSGSGCTTEAQALPEGPVSPLFLNLQRIVNNWNEETSRLFRKGDPLAALQDFQGKNLSGITTFLEHSKRSTRKPAVNKLLSGGEGLHMFLSKINDGWTNLHVVAFKWLQSLLMPNYGENSTKGITEFDGSTVQSTYTSCLWPDALKDTIVQVLLREDEYIYGRMNEVVTDFECKILRCSSGATFEYSMRNLSDLEMIQTVFELHLESYAQINNSNYEVDKSTRITRKDRLERWSMLARTSLSHFLDHSPAGKHRTDVALRHIWASTFQSNMAADAQREHVLLCLEDLKSSLHSIGNPVVHILNNYIMREISMDAVDQEVSKLRSMDFFLGIFDANSEDAVEIIEKIEPILEPSSVQYIEQEPSENRGRRRSASQEMASFLGRGDATLRLFLWQKLQDAYQEIDYVPKVMSCQLRSIETIVTELWTGSHLREQSDEDRQAALVKWLNSLDGFLAKAVTLTLQEPEKAYECTDMDHIKSSLSAVARLLKLLYSFTLYEDSVRVGRTTRPELRGSLLKSMQAFQDRLREMQVRCWILQYFLLKETFSQNREHFDTPSEDCIQYLCLVHNALGIRSMCRYSNKQFLKLMKSELVALDVKQEYEFEICQVLFDIYHVRFGASDGLFDHGCPPEKLDRSTAIMMIDLVMKQAKKLNLKDLSKSELKPTIDKMQQAIGMTKTSSPLMFNRRILSAYLKSPIDPSHLYRAVQGLGDLFMTAVPNESAEIAKRGWYFLLGCASLTRFRSQKRLNAVDTTDLDDAMAYFRQDLENDTGRWESWYRLAQTYDSKLDEDLTWSADKINNNQAELVSRQRCAIHCYSMAIATAIRTVEPTAENRALLSDLYTDFANRLYSSSREPLSMAAFSLNDFARHFSREDSQEMYKALPFKEMKLYSVWNFTGYLLKRAISDQPKRWMNHYMLGKCLWKMFSCNESVRGSSKRVDLDDLIESLLDAIDVLPRRKDTRSDPIFEPHFKLVSIVHKLVHRGALSPSEGSKILQETPWARKIQAAEDFESWEPYILGVLRRLKAADKSHWHHRMPVRAAHIIYDDHMDAAAAAAAKHELTQQIFTKTMNIQVWKPEFERPGRHFVYTTRYVYFFVRLLERLDDRAGLDTLLRRVRKKQNEFVNHSKLWEDVCLAYARVIRRTVDVREGYEDGIFKPMNWEDFVRNTAKLESLSQLASDSAILLELIRDTIEMKKLNNHLMKVTMFEDLIADLYSRLYEIHIPQINELVNEENREKMKVDNVLMTHDGTADTVASAATAPPSGSLLTPQPRGRTKGIARRDIQKRAETIVSSKLPPRAMTIRTAAAVDIEIPPPNVTNSVAVDQHGPSKCSLQNVNEPGLGQQSSIPNSLHDSGDDDSDLSEIDDERLSKLERKALLFPNLMDSKFPGRGSDLSGPSRVAGEEGEEGEADRYGEAETGEGDGVTDTKVAEIDDTDAMREKEYGEGDGGGNEVEETRFAGGDDMEAVKEEDGEKDSGNDDEGGTDTNLGEGDGTVPVRDVEGEG